MDAGTLVAVAGPAELAAEAARRVAAAAEEALARRGVFRIALAGGSTPRAAYGELARMPLEWSRWHVFFGDERCVAPTHADSNERMARAALLDRVPIPAAGVHRVRTELGAPEEVAADYERELRRAFALAGRDAIPRFDLVLLGLGPDGHTASLFPGSAALAEETRWVAAVRDAPKPPPERVTLTLPVLRAAETLLVLVAGAEKAAALAAARADDARRADSVAGRLRERRGALVWLADRAAAGRAEAPA